MNKIRKFEIENENFDAYFANEVVAMSEEDKGRIPDDMLPYLFRKNGRFNILSKKIPFIGKLYVLWRVLNKKVYIVIEDGKGFDYNEFFKYRNDEVLLSDAEDFREKHSFVLANKELAQSYAYFNNVSVSPAYNFISKNKNTLPSLMTVYKRQMEYITKMIAHYEVMKPVLYSRHGLGFNEWLTLIYLYEGTPINYTTFYRYFLNLFKNEKSTMQAATAKLQKKGYLTKYQSETKKKGGTMIRITYLGQDLVNSIVSKYVVNFPT